MSTEYKICSRCIMDTSSDPNLKLDENGVCNYCHRYERALEVQEKNDTRSIEDVINEIKEYGKGKKYDCILGLSGGVDSSYIAYLAHKYGLRVLAVHVDAGWNAEVAVENIKKICKKVKFDLHTVVVDWNIMKEVQRAFMFSGVANIDTPQDHVFAAAVYNVARKYKIKYILNGNNLATEGILSSAWQYTTTDIRNIKDICRKCGRKRIDFSKFPHYGFFDKHFTYPRIMKLQMVYLLDYVPYSKADALKKLEEEFGWNYYGGKHYESKLTKFIQEYYLLQRYGWDKRRDHLSSLVVGGEMTREEALCEIEKSVGNPEDIQKDIDYVLERLDISKQELDDIIKAPWKKGTDYKNQEVYEEFLRKVKRLIRYKRK